MPFVLTSLLLLMLGPPQAPPVQACDCGTISPFAEQARAAPVLLVGRVVGGVATRERGAARDVAAIDVELAQVRRGREERKQIRVWDQAAGTSCSLGMTHFRPNALVVIAVDPDEPRSARLSELSRIQPAADDYVLGACRQPWRLFSTQSELDAYIESGVWK